MVERSQPASAQSAVGNATILTIGAAAETVLQFVFLVIASRQLGPEEFGFYGYLLSIVTFAVTAAHFGLPVVGVRELSQRPADQPGTLAAIFRIRGSIALAVFVVAVVTAFFAPLTDAHRVAVWLMFAYLLFLPFDLSLLFDARKLSRWDVPGKLAGRTVSVGLLAGLWYFKGTVTVVDVALCSSLLMLVSAAVGWQVGRKLALPLKWLVPTTESWKLVRASAPVLWSNAMTIAYTQSQVILLKWQSTALETGYYSLASRLMMPVLVFRGVIYRVMLPLVSEVALDREALTARLERLLVMLALVFMPLVAIAIPAAAVLFVPVFGASYAGAVLPFQISISIMILTGTGAMFGTALLASGNARTPTVGLTWGCIISLGFAALTVPVWGATAAAWSAFLGELVSVSYTIPKFRKLCRPKVMGRLLRIATASLSGTAAYYVLIGVFSVPKLMALLAAILILIAALRVIGEISPARLRTMITLFKKPSPVPMVAEQPLDL